MGCTHYGVYFSVKWDWRTRQTPAENKQLEQIAEFLATHPKLVDLAVDLIPIDGLSSEEIQLLMTSAKSQDFESQKTENNGKR